MIDRGSSVAMLIEIAGIPAEVIETLSNPQQSWGESCTQVAITKATEKNSVVYYVRV